MIEFDMTYAQQQEIVYTNSSKQQTYRQTYAIGSWVLTNTQNMFGIFFHF